MVCAIILGQLELFADLKQLGAIGIFLLALIAVVVTLWNKQKVHDAEAREDLKMSREETRLLRNELQRYITEDRDRCTKLIENTTELLTDVKERLKK